MVFSAGWAQTSGSTGKGQQGSEVSTLKVFPHVFTNVVSVSVFSVPLIFFMGTKGATTFACISKDWYIIYFWGYTLIPLDLTMAKSFIVICL